MPDFIDEDFRGRLPIQPEDESFPLPTYMRAAITPGELVKLQAELEEIRRGIIQYEILERIYPRAFKLMQKRNFFVVVAIDEPYFPGVYALIRAREREMERWSDDDQATMDAALDMHEELKGEQNAGPE